MPNGLKVCTFNAKCDELDYNCCIKDPCSRKNCGDTNELPDSLVAAMIVMNLLNTTHKADIYNLQNVKNKCVVEHLLKELCRVKSITDCFTKDQLEVLSTQTTQPNPQPNLSTQSLLCKLNAFEGLCEDARCVKDALEECNELKLNYEEGNLCNYLDLPEYVAYHDNTSLTLVRKDLCLCPEVKTIPCVDSLVLVFEYCDRTLVNVNVDLGELVDSYDERGCKKTKVDSVVNFLRKYKDCADFIVAGAMGDLDYDVPQLLYSQHPREVAHGLQQFTTTNLTCNPVPADFPCDLCDQVYETMEFLLKTCNGENIPYSWLLQYLRVRGCGKCCAPKVVNKCCPAKPANKCQPKVKSVNNCGKCPAPSRPSCVPTGANRAHLRQHMRNRDKCGPSKPACSPPKNNKCKTKCDVPLKKCDECTPEKCEVRCKKPFECECRDGNKFVVNVDTCKKESCCDSCKDGKECHSENVCKPNSCDDFEYCDTVTVLKRDLCLVNTLCNVCDVNDRYTGYYNHYNKKLDCKYPRGMFQAWAMCDSYEKPCPTREIDNNSELLALDHVLVSEGLKNCVVNVHMSDLCIEKDVISTTPTTTTINNNNNSCELTDYSCSKVKAFFTNRVYCVTLDFPPKRRKCEVSCDEPLHTLGLTTFWCALRNAAESEDGGITYNCKEECIDVSVFAKYKLDKHPYFRDFFWSCVENKFVNKPVVSGDINVLNAIYSRCENKPLVCFSKNVNMCEEEFYKHLVNVLSNSDSRDRFVLTVGVMESVVRSPDIDNPENLYRHIDVCMCNIVKVSQYLSGVKNAVGNSVDENCLAKSLLPGVKLPEGDSELCCDEVKWNLLCDDNGEVSLDDIAAEMSKNCSLMDVLKRHAARLLDNGTWTLSQVANPVVIISGEDEFVNVNCPMESINKILRCVQDKNTRSKVLLNIIGKGCLSKRDR